MVIYVCAGCGRLYELPDRKLGRKVHCRACGTKGIVEDEVVCPGKPAASAVPPDDADALGEKNLPSRMSALPRKNAVPGTAGRRIRRAFEISAKVRCPACKQVLTVPDGFAGQRAKCPKCGQLIRVNVPAEPSVVAATAPPGRPSRGTLSAEGPRGIGGWLLFFCVGLTILGPLVSINQIVDGWITADRLGAFSMCPALKDICIVEAVGSAVLLIYGFAVGCILWRGSPNGRRLARQVLVVRFAGSLALGLILLLMMDRLAPKAGEVGRTELWPSIGGSFIWFVIWWAYFKKSKRVRNTYGPEGA